jgi:hypothetical protein
MTVGPCTSRNSRSLEDSCPRAKPTDASAAEAYISNGASSEPGSARIGMMTAMTRMPIEARSMRADEPRTSSPPPIAAATTIASWLTALIVSA